MRVCFGSVYRWEETFIWFFSLILSMRFICFTYLSLKILYIGPAATDTAAFYCASAGAAAAEAVL